MEGVNGYRQRLEVSRLQVRLQVNALEAIKEVLGQEADYLRRHDQADCLDALRIRISQQVSAIQSMETASAWGFTKGTFISAGIRFVVGSVIAAVARTSEHPLLTGARLGADELAKTAPFGAVAVAVGSGGIPDDVRVVPLSRWAREQNRCESEIAAALEANGYRLMVPEAFSAVLEELKEKVLKGVLVLPVSTSSLVQKVADDRPESTVAGTGG